MIQRERKIVDIGDTFLLPMDMLTIDNVAVNSHFKNIHGISKDSRCKISSVILVEKCADGGY